MAYILHIDTSTQTGRVALAYNGEEISKRINAEERDHASVINDYIEAVLKDAGIKFDELDAVAVIGGPGSYTGLRISLATAKGLCYALQKPLLMHNRLHLMCLQKIEEQPGYDSYISLLPARENEFFTAAYNGFKECIYPPQHIHQKELEELLGSLQGKILLSGNAALTLPTFISYMPAANFSEQIWYEQTHEDFQEKKFADLAAATPFYLKSVYTTQKK